MSSGFHPAAFRVPRSKYKNFLSYCRANTLYPKFTGRHEDIFFINICDTYQALDKLSAHTDCPYTLVATHYERCRNRAANNNLDLAEL